MFEDISGGQQAMLGAGIGMSIGGAVASALAANAEAEAAQAVAHRPCVGTVPLPLRGSPPSGRAQRPHGNPDQP